MTLREKRIKTLNEAIAKFGYRKQSLKLIEELNELSRSVSRYLASMDIDGTSTDAEIDDIAQEVADVLIMLYQHKLMMPELHKKICKQIVHKVDRLQNTIMKLKAPMASCPLKIYEGDWLCSKDGNSTYFVVHIFYSENRKDVTLAKVGTQGKKVFLYDTIAEKFSAGVLRRLES